MISKADEYRAERNKKEHQEFLLRFARMLGHSEPQVAKMKDLLEGDFVARTARLF